VKAACQEFRGRVVKVIKERDGDHHIWALPDQGYSFLLNGQNNFQGAQAMVLEISPACTGQPADSQAAAHCPPSPIQPPAMGDHIRALGPWNFDSEHGWNEIHPVNVLEKLP
jgi:hypothetical protein